MKVPPSGALSHGRHFDRVALDEVIVAVAYFGKRVPAFIQFGERQ